MAITSTCPHCGAQQPVADDAVGKTIHCKQCDRPFEVVSPASATPSSENASAAPPRQEEDPAHEESLESSSESTSAAPESPSTGDEDSPGETAPSSEQREPALGESARERASELWAQAQPGLRKAGESLLSLLRRGLAGVVTVAQFYGRAWRDLSAHSRESAAAPEGSRHAEIRLSVEDDYEHATWNRTCWEVRLPDQCVECGQPTEEDWTEEVRTIPNLTWQPWAPLAGLGVGIVLSLPFWSLWPLPIAFVVGSLAGYLRRRETEVRLGFRRCGKHAASTRYPGLRVDAGVLVVAVGDRSVKVEFLARERPGPRVAVTPRPAPKTGDSDSPAATPGRREQIAPIPLADEVHATVSEPPPEDPAPTPLAEGADISEVEPEIVLAGSGEPIAPSPAGSKSAPPPGAASTRKSKLGSNPCPWCGEERPPGANVCNACGHGLRVEKRVSKRKEPASDELGISCPGCGQSLGPTDRICVHCGFELRSGRRAPGHSVSGGAGLFPDRSYRIRKSMFGRVVRVFDSRRRLVLYARRRRRGLFWLLRTIEFHCGGFSGPYLTASEQHARRSEAWEWDRKFTLNAEGRNVGNVLHRWQAGRVTKVIYLSLYGKRLAKYVFEPPEAIGCAGCLLGILSLPLALLLWVVQEIIRIALLILDIIVAILMSPFTIFKALTGAREGELREGILSFRQGETVAATLSRNLTLDAIRRRFRLDRHLDRGDVEVCLILSTLTIMDVLPVLAEPYQLTDDAFWPRAYPGRDVGKDGSPALAAGFPGGPFAAVKRVFLALLIIGVLVALGALAAFVASRQGIQFGRPGGRPLGAPAPVESSEGESDSSPEPQEGKPESDLEDRNEPEDHSEPTLRPWNDLSGEHSTEATFVDFQDGKVRLKKKDATIITLPIEQLSGADREYVRRITEPSPTPAQDAP